MENLLIMKHLRLSFILIISFILYNCNEDSKKLVTDTDNGTDAPSMRFYGSMESRSDSLDATKATLGGTSTDDTRKVLWEPSDYIYVTNGSTGSKFKNIVKSNTDMAEFLGNINPGTNYFAAFPYGVVKNYSSSSFKITLPSVQTYKTDGISSESFPMVAQCVDNVFEFKNLCGILVLNLIGTQVIDSIRFSGKDTQDNTIKVSGSASVSMSYKGYPELVMSTDADTLVVLNCIGSNNKGVTLSTNKATPFHIVLPAGIYSHFTIKIYSSDSRTMTINSDKTLEIKRSKRTTASNIEYLADKLIYEFVDLGLSVCWATCNVGAYFPEDYGDYFAWGDTATYYKPGHAQSDAESIVWKDDKSTGYVWETYKYSNGTGSSLTKYCNDKSKGYEGYTDSDTTLLYVDDVAHYKWGGNWRMPTRAEFDELIDGCDCEVTTQNGVKGLKATSRMDPNQSIFLPAAGLRHGKSLGLVITNGEYWSSSLDTGNPIYAWCFRFFSGGVGEWSDPYRYRIYGRSLRPVCLSETWLNDVSIALNENQLSMYVGTTSVLTATVRHKSDVIDRPVIWSSNNPSVATVDKDGMVTSIKAGIATITANYEGKTATCEITVSEPVYEYVDLGLSVNWATCNVGASSPEEYGDYFAWGETETKSEYTWATYKYCKGSENTLTKYCDDSNYGNNGFEDNIITLLPEDDVAHVKWGGKWRMPTEAEFNELIYSCDWAWTTQNGVMGYKVTSKKTGYTGCSIFLPATEDYDETYGYHIRTCFGG